MGEFKKRLDLLETTNNNLAQQVSNKDMRDKLLQLVKANLIEVCGIVEEAKKEFPEHLLDWHHGDTEAIKWFERWFGK